MFNKRYLQVLQNLLVANPPPPRTVLLLDQQAPRPRQKVCRALSDRNYSKCDVVCGVEWRFMVCMELRMSPRIPIQKTDLRDFFRRTNPATRKSSPNLVGAYMRRAGKRNSKPTQLNYTCLGGCS